MIEVAASGVRTTRRCAVWLALALCAHAAPAQTPSPPNVAASAPALSSSPDPRQQLQGAALVRALRAGGLVIYFRHTATDFSKNDREMRGYDDCDHQRPL